MEGSQRKVLVVSVAALGYDLLRRWGCVSCGRLEFAPAAPVLPGVTCVAQASFRTAETPQRHGMIANGLYVRPLHRAMFWEQSADLVAGERIWADARRRGRRVAMLFWQQSLGEDVDVVLSPAPIHKHHGGLVQDCYSRPAGLYRQLCDRIGRRFDLMRYWGPLASAKVGDWIAQATAHVLADADCSLVLTYLPTLDYDLQRFGPESPQARRALDRLWRQLGLLLDSAGRRGYEVIVFGDYAIAPCDRAVLPNIALRQAGLLAVRNVAGMEYVDFHASKAFAVVDHELAHVYVRDTADLAAARECLSRLAGVGDVLDRQAMSPLGLDHPNSGELLVTAAERCWLAYPWWQGRRHAPDYARHIDIHNKPGFDPCELFFGWPPLSVSQNPARIRGTHGRTGPGREIAWASTVNLPLAPLSLLDLARGTAGLLETL